MSAYHNPRIAFQLGEDYAYYGLRLTGFPELMSGYEYGIGRYGHRCAWADRYVRKWLQLRVNAWNRNREFADDVTPQYLKTLEQARCPVTGEVLTHGLREATDWSIDRVDNEVDYVRGNLMVMSIRANQAKSDLGYWDVHRRATGEIQDEALACVEWACLRTVMAGSCLKKDIGELVPLVLREALPPDLPAHPSIAAQLRLSNFVSFPRPARNSVHRCLDKVLADSREPLSARELFAVMSRPAKSSTTTTPRRVQDLFMRLDVQQAFTRFWWGGIHTGPQARRLERLRTLLTATNDTCGHTARELARARRCSHARQVVQRDREQRRIQGLVAGYAAA